MTHEERYTIARWAYSIGKPIMSDSEYDVLKRAVAPDDDTPWSLDNCPKELLTKYGMEEYIVEIELDTSTTASITSVTKRDFAEQHYAELANDSFLISYKMDGWSTQAFYINGNLVSVRSRGRRTDSVSFDAARCVLPQTITIKEPTRIVGELFLTEASYNEMCHLKQYDNARSAVSGALAHAPHLLSYYAFRIDTEEAKYNTVLDNYKLLGSLGFITPYYEVCSGYEVIKMCEHISENRDYSLPTDGLVVQRLNPGKSPDIYALRIFSWQQPIFAAHILGYEENYGRHFISIQLIIEPTDTGTGVQKRVDIDNCSRIMELGLYPGKFVIFEKVSHAVEKILPELTKLANERGSIDGLF